jgi:hypothetical protein
MTKPIGYVISYDGSIVHASRRTDESGRLFIGKHITLYPTYDAARNAARRSLKAWGDGGGSYRIVPVRRPPQ